MNYNGTLMNTGLGINAGIYGATQATGSSLSLGEWFLLAMAVFTLIGLVMAAMRILPARRRDVLAAANGVRPSMVQRTGMTKR